MSERTVHCGDCSQRQRWWDRCHCGCHMRARRELERLAKSEGNR